MTTDPSSDVLERLAEGRRMFVLAAATLERDVLLHGLTEDEQNVLVGAVLNAADRAQSATIERLSAERFDDVVAAYRAGAEAVHDHWAERSDEVSAEGNIGGPDFTEAAHEYARSLTNTAENG
jgi:hypothetical protein